MMQEAGGGGYGNEKERDLPTLKKDQEIGYIS